MKDIALLISRIAFGGLMFINHAIPKFGKLTSTPIRFPDPIGVGSEISLFLALFAEGLCGILLVFGLFTRLASIPLAITMAVAAFIVHNGDSLSVKESAFMYLAAYVFLYTFGGGKFSLDYLIRPKARF